MSVAAKHIVLIVVGLGAASLSRGASPALEGPAAATAPATQAVFSLTSPAVPDGGALPKEFTGDGEAATLPLEWVNAPDGTKSFALVMHHVAPDMTKWYWIVYNIPATTTELPKNAHGVGTLGNNSVNGRTEYAPPHSKGPGPKTYIYTVYALSSTITPTVKESDVNRDVLLAAMKGKILASAEMRVIYSRNVQADPAGNN